MNNSNPSESTPRKKILIVEDSEGVRVSLEMSLEYAGYEVKSVENGKVALHLLEQYRPDLILSDVNMPVMNGLEMGETIRKSGVLTPIIYFSTVIPGTPQADRAALITKLIMSKGTSMRELKDAVAEALSQAA